MKRMFSILVASVATCVVAFSACAEQTKPVSQSAPSTVKASTAAPMVVASAEPTAKAAPAVEKKVAVAPAAKVASGDTLVVVARCIEIPGSFPPNDLYNYVYIMKYKVMKVIKGSYADKEILVGVYNPLILRANVKDKMASFVGGDVQKFEEGGLHKLVLIKPISKVWKDAIENEYIDSELPPFYALKTDISK